MLGNARNFLLAGLTAMIMLTQATPARAGGVVVVELFTSQGCSSCPPADELLGQLARSDDIIALSMHVDYWDYLGWRDIFAQPQFTARQVAYRDAVRERSVYTPQIVVNGVDRLVGSRHGRVLDSVRRHSARSHPAEVELSSMGDMIKARIAPAGEPTPPATVWIVNYDDAQAVRIKRGENRGRAIVYHNVARDLMRMGRWDGASEVELSAPVPSAAKGVAVLLQVDGHGPIIGAAKIEFE